MKSMMGILLSLLVLVFLQNTIYAQNCVWSGVQNAGINSHQPGRPWCPDGYFLVALDLDGPRNYSAHDTPVVGQAKCCQAVPGGSWGHSLWMQVENAGINSHQPGNYWCPMGYFLVALDLDSRNNYAPHDSPIVGQTYCSSIRGKTPNWSKCQRMPVETGGINSHQPGSSWCPNGAFLVGMDLDGPRNYAGHDTPIVGQAECCWP